MTSVLESIVAILQSGTDDRVQRALQVLDTLIKSNPGGVPIHGVEHPSHYGGKDNPYEAIKVIDAWDLGFSLGNAVKYIARAGKKEGESDARDLGKAKWYLEHEIARRQQQTEICGTTVSKGLYCKLHKNHIGPHGWSVQ